MPVVEEGKSVSALAPPSRFHNPKASCWVPLGESSSSRMQKEPLCQRSTELNLTLGSTWHCRGQKYKPAKPVQGNSSRRAIYYSPYFFCSFPKYPFMGAVRDRLWWNISVIHYGFSSRLPQRKGRELDYGEWRMLQPLGNEPLFDCSLSWAICNVIDSNYTIQCQFVYSFFPLHMFPLLDWIITNNNHKQLGEGSTSIGFNVSKSEDCFLQHSPQLCIFKVIYTSLIPVLTPRLYRFY